MNGLANNANMPSLVFINDPVAGVSMALNSKNKTGLRSPMRTAAAGRGAQRATQQGEQAAVRPRRNSANSANLKTDSLGTKSFDGVIAEGHRTTMTIPAGQIGNEQ